MAHQRDGYRVWNIMWATSDGSENLPRKVEDVIPGDMPESERRQFQEDLLHEGERTALMAYVQNNVLSPMAQVVSLDWRPVTVARHVGTFSMTVGIRRQVYGGPEEGGWWYPRFFPERVFTVGSDYCCRLSHWLNKYVDAQNEGRRELSSVLNTEGRWDCFTGIQTEPDPTRHYE